MQDFCKIYKVDGKQVLVILKEDDPDEDTIEITFQPFESSIIETITVAFHYKATMGRVTFDLLDKKEVEKITNEIIDTL